MDGQCPDHDTVIELGARFNEYRNAIELRLEKLNELRESVTADRNQFIRQDVYYTRLSALEARLEEDRKAISALGTWQSRMMGVGFAIIAMAGLLGGMIGHVWH